MINQNEDPSKIQLHKDQRRLLKYIYRKSINLGDQEFVDLSLAPNTIINNNQLTNYVRTLNRNGLIVCDGSLNPVNGNYVQDLNLVKATEKASEYFKWQSEYFRKFIYRSIAVPIVVAITTSLITTILLKTVTNLLTK